MATLCDFGTKNETDSDSDSSTESDFNFGDMTDFNKHTLEKHANNDNNITNSLNCNLNVIESEWFMINDGKEEEQQPTKVHRNNKILKSMRYKCELFYAQRKYKEALEIIEEIFREFDVDPHNQFGNELIDILVRCLCKTNDFENALKQIDKLLARDVSFGTMELLINIYNQTNEYQKGYQFAMNLTKKEPLNPICWYHLSISLKNVKQYDFCFVCLRLLQFNVNFYAKIDRYSKSKLYTNKLLNYAKDEMEQIKQYLTTKELIVCPLNNIGKLFENGDKKIFEFIEEVSKRFNFSYIQNQNDESFVNEIDLLLQHTVHSTKITDDMK